MRDNNNRSARRIISPSCSVDFKKKLMGYSLTTAEILYRMPDHQTLLQSFVWQDYDLHPRFPNLRKFLDFWAENLDGPLHQVRVAHSQLVTPTDFEFVDGELVLN